MISVATVRLDQQPCCKFTLPAGNFGVPWPLWSPLFLYTPLECVCTWGCLIILRRQNGPTCDKYIATCLLEIIEWKEGPHFPNLSLLTEVVCLSYKCRITIYMHILNHGRGEELMVQ